MEPSRLNTNLHEEKGRLIQKFASLTDDDLLFEEGRNEEIFGKYQIRIEQTKEDLEHIVSNLDF
jgi:uncharacterized protein YjbJ (UPF0337 family)